MKCLGKIVTGHSRRIVRPRKPAHVPPRRTVEEEKHYRQWLGDRDVLLSTGDANDCGCALCEFGCYSFLVATLMAQQVVEKLLNSACFHTTANLGLMLATLLLDLAV